MAHSATSPKRRTWKFAIAYPSQKDVPFGGCFWVRRCVLWGRGLTGLTPESARASHHRSPVLPASYARPSCVSGVSSGRLGALVAVRRWPPVVLSLGRHRPFFRYLSLLPSPRDGPSLPRGSRLPSRCAGCPGAGHDSKDTRPPLCEDHSFAECVGSLPILQSAPESSRTLLIHPLLEQPGFSLSSTHPTDAQEVFLRSSPKRSSKQFAPYRATPFPAADGVSLGALGRIRQVAKMPTKRQTRREAGAQSPRASHSQEGRRPGRRKESL
jgi:hypothetical protein